MYDNYMLPEKEGLTKKEIKEKNMRQLYEQRELLKRNPCLVYLFFELTDACNMVCLHCGSCASPENRTYLSFDAVKRVLKEVAEKYEPHSIMICLTGGEPMLHPDFYEIAQSARTLGFQCGITTNATLIDAEAAKKIKDSGIRSVSVSLDGLEETHDWFRNCDGAYKRTVEGIKNLVSISDDEFAVQVTTVVHKKNMGELDGICKLLTQLCVDSWRIANIDPIGRALEHDELLPGADEMKALLEYIRMKRFDNSLKMHISYGCSHYTGIEYENEIRDHYFYCGSGLSVASVLCNGDIYSCLDIERRPELIQGNVFRDSFTDVWEHKFSEFRRDRTEDCADCKACEERLFCMGDSAHTWDYDKKMPKLCLKKLISERKENNE